MSANKEKRQTLLLNKNSDSAHIINSAEAEKLCTLVLSSTSQLTNVQQLYKKVMYYMYNRVSIKQYGSH